MGARERYPLPKVGSAAASAASLALQRPHDAVSYFCSAVPNSHSCIAVLAPWRWFPPIPSQNPPLRRSSPAESFPPLTSDQPPSNAFSAAPRYRMFPPLLSYQPSCIAASMQCCSLHQSNLRTLPAAASSPHSPSFHPFPHRASLLFPQAILLIFSIPVRDCHSPHRSSQPLKHFSVLCVCGHSYT